MPSSPAARAVLFVLLGMTVGFQPTASSGETGNPRVLSAFFGDSVLPAIADVALCPPPSKGTGFGGMPIVFSHAIDPNGLDPSDFVVRVLGDPHPVTPLCATLQPAVDGGENRTVLLTGEFGKGGINRPRRIKVVGDLRTMDGETLTGLTFRRVDGLDAGPNLVLAERFVPGDGIIATSPAGEAAFCPTGQTAVVVKLTFTGGVSTINGGSLQGDPTAIDAIQVVAENVAGDRIVLTPFALCDVDNDNHLDACFGTPAANLPLLQVAVDSHVFYRPQNALNRAGTVDID